MHRLDDTLAAIRQRRAVKMRDPPQPFLLIARSPPARLNCSRVRFIIPVHVDHFHVIPAPGQTTTAQLAGPEPGSYILDDPLFAFAAGTALEVEIPGLSAREGDDFAVADGDFFFFVCG